MGGGREGGSKRESSKIQNFKREQTKRNPAVDYYGTVHSITEIPICNK